MILSRIPIDRRYWKSFVTKSMKHIYWMKIYWKEDSCTKISLLFIDNNEKKVPNWSRGGHNMYYWLFLQAVRYNTVLNPISRMGGPLRENWKRSQHKRNEEGDQGGPWSPLEGPKVEYRRSQDLPDYYVKLNAESLFSQYQPVYLWLCQAQNRIF